MSTNATYNRTITVDLPDYGSKSIDFTLLTTVAIDAANNEVFPRKEYSLTLDANGAGSIALPCPDNSGTSAWAWRVSLPDGRDVTTTMAYAGTSLDLSDWLTAEATTETASTIQALVSGKADKVTGATADNLASLDVNGNLQDSGYGVIDEDSMATDSATDVPTQQSVKAYVDTQIGTVDDVTELTTTTGASTNMLRVAAAGGLEYRTTAEVLGDIGAAATSHTHVAGDIDSGAATDGHVLTADGAGNAAWEAPVSGVNDVDELTTTTGASTNMLRVAAAGGLEYRTTAQVLSDIGAETAGAAATVQGNLDSHTGNTSNPHSVTAAQVGAYTTAQTDSAIDTDIGTHAALTSSVHGISVFGATLVDDADAATARGTLGLGSAAVEDASAFDAAGSAAAAQAASQPLDADLTAIAGLSSADGNFIVGSATGWVAESGATARTSLGLGTMATEATTSYLAATGATTGATSSAQDFTNGITVAGGSNGISAAGVVTGTGLAITGTANVIKSGTTSGTLLGTGAAANSASNSSYTAIGNNAGNASVSNSYWTAVGRNAGFSNTSGAYWVAVGYTAGQLNASGGNWVAIGNAAAAANTSGSTFMALGSNAGASSTNGSGWVAVGDSAAKHITTGQFFIASGYNAGRYINSGSNATTNSGFIAIGYDSRFSTDGTSNEIVIGYQGRGNGSNTTTIGNSSTTHFYGLGIHVLPSGGAPASAAATGTAGSIVWDADYIYVCTATNTWKRAAIATW